MNIFFDINKVIYKYENDGTLKLLFPDIGFGIRMIFPIKYKR